MNRYYVETYNLHLEPSKQSTVAIVEAESAAHAIAQHCGIIGGMDYTSRRGPALRHGEHEDNAHWQRNPSLGTIGAWAMRLTMDESEAAYIVTWLDEPELLDVAGPPTFTPWEIDQARAICAAIEEPEA
jgi:hypothetical protein